jgi:hypothetical protein
MEGNLTFRVYISYTFLCDFMTLLPYGDNQPPPPDPELLRSSFVSSGSVETQVPRCSGGSKAAMFTGDNPCYSEWQSDVTCE